MKTLLRIALTASATLLLSVQSPASYKDSLRISNPAKAPSLRTVQLQELWRVGGDSDIEGELFGRIGGLVADAQGNIYVLDQQTHDVRVFDAHGGFIRSFGREGEGPGEFRDPIGLVAMPNGQIAIYQGSPPRMSLFASDGTYAGEFHFAQDEQHPFLYLSKVQADGGALIVNGLDSRTTEGATEQVSRVMRYATDGTFVCEVMQRARSFDFNNMIVREDNTPYAIFGPDDSVLVADGWNYEINVYGRDCRLKRVIARDYAHLARSSAEVKARTDHYRRHGAGNARIEISKYARDVQSMAVRDDGQLWVLSGRGGTNLPQDTLGVFDVYDHEGRLAEQVELKGEGNPRTDCYYFIADRLYVVRHCFAPKDGSVDEPEPTEVICYRLQA